MTNKQSKNTTGTAVYQQRAAKRRPFWTAQSCRPERYINRDQQSERISGTAVYQQRSAKQNPTGTAAPAFFFAKRKYNWPSRISTTSSKAKALLDDTSVSTRTVYQPRSSKRKHIWHSRISTAISRAKAHLTQQAMMGVYPHGGITNQPSGNTSGTAVYQQQTAKRKPFWTTQPCRPERYVNRDQQIESVSGTAVYQQRSAKQTPSGTAAPAINRENTTGPGVYQQ